MQKKLSIILVVIVFGALLTFAGTKGMLTDVSSAVQKTTSPVTILFSNASHRISGLVSGVFSLGKLQKENANLKDTVNKLQAEVAQLSEAKKENESLRKTLGFVKSHNFSYEPVEVVAFDPSNIRGMVTINKGSNAGLKTGMAVISDGFLVGRISEVTEDSSKVQLVTDPTSAIPVTLQSTTTNGLAKGEIGFGLTMDKIPQGEKIQVGDTVISSGLGGEIPKGLILGKVEKIIKKENSLFISATIRPSANMDDVYRLIVIKG